MSNRILSLLRPGSFRFFLAVVVLVSHSCRVDPGDWAVYSFFILSGYWICRMWEDKYSKTGAPWAVFLASRLTRLLPVFLLANLATALVLLRIDPGFLDSSVPGWGRLPALASNILILGYSSLPHSQGGLHVAWSLDVEMQFYLAFPILIALLGRGRRAGFWEAFLCAACLAGLSLFLMPLSPGPRNLGCCGLFFFVGVVAARREWKPSTATVSTLLWVAAGLVALVWIIPDWRFLLENEKHGATAIDHHHKRIAQAALAFLTSPIALYTVTRPSGASDRALGEFTYVLYLMHWPVLLVHTFYFGALPPLSRLPSLLAAWAVVGAVSLAVFRYVDQPIERIRKRWVGRRVMPRPVQRGAGG